MAKGKRLGPETHVLAQVAFIFVGWAWQRESDLGPKRRFWYKSLSMTMLRTRKGRQEKEMSDINVVAISGRLTRDAEIRGSVLTLGVAVNERRKNSQTGEWTDVPSFIDVTVFGNRVQPLSNILRKGMRVTVSGKLRQSSWEKDGQRHSKVEVIADEVVFPPREGGYQQPSYQQAPQQAPYQQPQQQFYPNQAPAGYQQQYQCPTAPAMDLADESIPF